MVVVSCLAKTISSTPELAAASAQVYSGVVAGLVIISLTTVFHPVSGAHINPAISLAMLLIRRVSPIRAIGHVVAQCGGAIAGASVVLGLYGATEHFPTITVTNFGLEFLLTFMIVLVYLRVTDDQDDHDPGLAIGVSYMAALGAYRGALNPAFALGQAFVTNTFDNHWIFWIGPLVGGASASLSHEYIFNDQKDTDLTLPDSDACDNTAKDSDEETMHKIKPHNSEVVHNETDSVYDDHLPEYVTSKPRTHGRSYSLHAGHGRRIAKDAKDTRGQSEEERKKKMPGERILYDHYDESSQIRCESFLQDNEEPGDKYSYWHTPQNRNNTGRYHRRKSVHERPHLTRPNNHSEDHPTIRLTKAGSLPREMCHSAIRVKHKHRASLHNLCENNNTNHRTIVL